MYNSDEKTAHHNEVEEAKVNHDTLSFRGEITIEVRDKDGNLISKEEDKNFIVDLGHETVVDILTGTITSRVFRMAIGAQGTMPGLPYTPKSPDATWPSRTGLYWEVIRQNIDTTTQPTSKSMKFLTSFSSADIDNTSFGIYDRAINEAALFISDGTQTGQQQINKTPPDSVTISEKMFSVRTFKSQPFDPADILTLSITWTIYVQ